MAMTSGAENSRVSRVLGDVLSPLLPSQGKHKKSFGDPKQKPESKSQKTHDAESNQETCSKPVH